MHSDDMENSKTEEEVRETLQLACIKESEINNMTQVLHCVSRRGSEQCIKLLELDEHLLTTINRGDSLSFQGKRQECAVLCTKDRTYDIKEAETSNSWLLIPDLKLSKDTDDELSDRVTERRNVQGIFHTYYEVRECKPRLEKLLAILEPSSFKGLEYESAVDAESLYDWDRLRNEIQASEDELSRALLDYLVANMNGHLRLISFECEVRTLTFMLDLFDENCWELDGADQEITYEALKDLIPKPVFDTVFKKYTRLSDRSKEDGSPLFKYDETSCCKTLAKVLLAASPVTDYKQFMDSWRIGTPEKMKPRVEYLSGIALVTRNAQNAREEVISFPEANLPKNINERFNELFRVKDKWTVHEITPYVQSLATSKMNVNALLTKYARCSTINDVKCYSSKHGK
ncbi:hypothetical protein KM043_003065 [Ampulex compressa]|nr:hypothetical protein KM043_003065 [Ampulex compressa]